MKYIAFIFGVCAILYLASCVGGGRSTFGRYEIINNSDHSVVLKSFDMESRELQKTIQLPDKGGAWMSEKFKISGPSGGWRDPDLGGDSLRIEFDSLKVLVYTYDTSGENILLYDNYDLIKVNAHNEVRKYTLTDTHYKKATLIED